MWGVGVWEVGVGRCKGGTVSYRELTHTVHCWNSSVITISLMYSLFFEHNSAFTIPYISGLCNATLFRLGTCF